jgi:hypothetical protein
MWEVVVGDQFEVPSMNLCLEMRRIAKALSQCPNQDVNPSPTEYKPLTLTFE